MKNLMFVDTKEEAAMVERLFDGIRKTLDEGKGYRDARSFDEAAFMDGRGESFSDYPNDDHPSAACVAGVAGAFPHGELVRIPYGSLVYVYRDIGDGWAVYDAYSFGYHGNFAVEKDIEGDLAGLANLSADFFPNI
jgi:hypothetical protein